MECKDLRKLCILHNSPKSASLTSLKESSLFQSSQRAAVSETADQVIDAIMQIFKILLKYLTDTENSSSYKY